MSKDVELLNRRLSRKDKSLQEARQRIDSLSKLLKVAEIIVSATNVKDLLEVIMRMAEKIMNAEASSLTLADEKTGDLRFVVARGESGGAIRDKPIKLGQGICGWVAKTGECLILNDPYKDPRFDPSFDKVSGFRTRSYLCMPLKTFDGRVIGTIQVLNKKKGRFTKKDAEIFTHFCNLSAIAIRTQQLLTRRDDQEQLQADLDYANSIQQNFLPKVIPQLKDYYFDAAYLPAMEVGGDFYDVVHLGNNRVAVYIADVSGKGIAAALFMSKMTSDFRSLLENEKDPAIVMKKINNQVLERSSRGMFVTLLVLIIEMKIGRVEVFNAGHISPLLLGANKTASFQIGENPPVGVMRGFNFKSQEFLLRPGERIVLLTDGVTDIRDNKGKLLGIEGVRKLIDRHRASRDFMGDFLKEIDRHTRASLQSDDITVVTVFRSPRPDYGFVKKEMVAFTDADYTAGIGSMIEGVAKQVGFTRKDTHLIIVAVLEAFSNIVKYAYDEEVGKIGVRVIREGKALKIFLRDYGEKVEEEKIVPRDLKDIKPGGLGVHFIREIMDSVEYLPAKDGNELRLIKKAK